MALRHLSIVLLGTPVCLGFVAEPVVAPKKGANAGGLAAARPILEKWGLVDGDGRDVERSGAVISVYDAKTRSRAILVGTMHFNPHSIALARDVVSAEAMRGRLRAVAVESCPTRWNSTYGVAPVNSLLRTICDNEMQGAAEAGEEAGVRTILADQSIEDTGARA